MCEITEDGDGHKTPQAVSIFSHFMSSPLAILSCSSQFGPLPITPRFKISQTTYTERVIVLWTNKEQWTHSGILWVCVFPLHRLICHSAGQIFAVVLNLYWKGDHRWPLSIWPHHYRSTWSPTNRAHAVQQNNVRGRPLHWQHGMHIWTACYTTFKKMLTA